MLMAPFVVDTATVAETFEEHSKKSQYPKSKFPNMDGKVVIISREFDDGDNALNNETVASILPFEDEIAKLCETLKLPYI